MYRTQCVLALIALYAGLADTFSWDILVSRDNRLEFYNKEKLTHSVSLDKSDISIAWRAYDPIHNRVLFSNKLKDGKCIYTFDIATRKTQPLINSNPCRDIDPDSYVYDPATGLLFGVIKKLGSVYSFLIKSGSNNEVGDGNLVMDSLYDVVDAQPMEFAIESCGGYIYWTTNNETNRIERARFNGSGREIIIDGGKMYRHALTIDSQTQKMYFCENEFNYYLDAKLSLVSADLNGKNIKTIYRDITRNLPYQLTVSKDFIYWIVDQMSIRQLPKNLSNDTNIEPKQFLINTTPRALQYIVANYKIEEQTQGTPLCEALKSVSSNDSATDDSLNLSTEVNLLRDPETTVSGESRISERCDVSVCQYYCFQGECSISAEGQPRCSCYAGYLGQRCEVQACQGYCLNDGICSLNEESAPVCECTQDYEGDRCEVPVNLQDLFTKTIIKLNEILNEVTETKGRRLLEETAHVRDEHKMRSSHYEVQLN